MEERAAGLPRVLAPKPRAAESRVEGESEQQSGGAVASSWGPLFAFQAGTGRG